MNMHGNEDSLYRDRRQNFVLQGEYLPVAKPILRWPTSVTAKLSFSRQNFLSHGKTLFLTAKHSFSRENFLSHGKTFFLTAKHSFSRQNFLSHGKTLFLTAKLSFSRQNTLSHGKTFFLTAKHSFSRQNFLSHGKTFFLTAKLSFSKQNTLSHGKTFFLTAKLSFSKQAVISATLVGLLTLETWILHVSSVHSDSQWQCGWKMIWRRMEVNLQQFYGEPLCPSFEDDAKQSGIQDCYSGRGANHLGKSVRDFWDFQRFQRF